MTTKKLVRVHEKFDLWLDKTSKETGLSKPAITGLMVSDTTIPNVRDVKFRKVKKGRKDLFELDGFNDFF